MGHAFPVRVFRSSLVGLVVGVAILLAVLLVAGYLRGQNKYPDPVALAAATPYQNTFFDPDPNHPWNQLYGMLFIRPAWNGKLYGQDEMDPLYWGTTRYLLDGPLHQKALAALDLFIQSGSAQRIKDPLKRALLQRMLWAVFDRWSHRFFDPYDRDAIARENTTFASEHRELQIRLVKIMRSVALTDEEIDALPNNYNRESAAKAYPPAFDPTHVDQPFLPATFFSRADWVELGTDRYEQVAPVHVKAVSGRSDFHVLISLPSGRSDTLAYLKRLHDFQPHWVYDQSKAGNFFDRGGEGPPWTNADVPQVPPFTKFALVRTANLINNKGEIRNSPLMESVQIRVIRTILPNHSSGGEQSFFLFTLDQRKLLQGEGGLVARGKDDLGFDLVLEYGQDPLQKHSERSRDPVYHGEFSRVSSCFSCHSAPGIFSMNSYIQFFQDRRTLVPPTLQEGTSESLEWKQEQYNWGLLQAYWFTQ